MELRDLINKHDINLPDDIIQLCEQGIEIMRGAVDLSHSHFHIERIITDFDSFYCNEVSIRNSSIDFEALLLAICWHDTWRSQIVTSNLITGTYVLIKDGYGSSKLFAKEAEKAGLNRALIKKVTHIINKHSWFQRRGIKHIEARILKDIDELELFSISRLQEIELTFLKTNSSVNKGFIKGLRTFYRVFLEPYTKDRLYFHWTKEQLTLRREEFIVFANEYLAKHSQAFERELDCEELDEMEIQLKEKG